MADNQIQSLQQTAISIAEAQLKKVHSEIKEELLGVTLQWSQISIFLAQWGILPDPQEIIWKRVYWDFIPGETEFADGCVCSRPTKFEGVNRCTCLWEARMSSIDVNFAAN